ncbi:MAG TPA: arsinothricin resistance N-acetyltransferase ArsN1 family B [Thermoanaerobaculia bacterium]|nr:arsinothricin resistance N-acetyltransferase ArsN1 family B [Thermoanaerobaculia bacterium]
MNIRAATPSDALALATIYNHYVRETIVTFEEEPVSPEIFSRRIEDVLASALPWLVAFDDETAVGYAYATPWKPRSGYRFSVEVTVYVTDGYAGRGIGSALYGELFPQLEARGVHAAMGGIALPNAASIALHEKFGMRKVAHFEQVGFKFGRWIDVGYWERIFAATGVC